MPKQPKKTDYSDDFKTAWKSYPRRDTSKKEAFAAYKKAILRATVQEILRGVEMYAQHPETIGYLEAGTPRYIKHMTRWLNGDCWEAEPPPGTKPHVPLGETMSRKRAEKIWASLDLSFNCSCDEDQFLAYITANQQGEFRFQGTLGFGGKFYFNWPTEIRVSCYQEDETPDRVRAIGCKNADLDSTLAKWRREAGETR